MKKILLVAIPLLFSLTITLCSSTSGREGGGIGDEISDSEIRVLSKTKSVEIPKFVHFADEKVDLDRYDMHERFDREINSFTYFHSTTLLLIKRANRYFPIIEPILKKNGIPDDFKYLAVIESSLDPRAVSSARAAGLWQFMISTGKVYGLDVNSLIDERRDPIKSSYAAAHYLQDLYQIFGDWTLVIAAYNCGPANVNKAIRRAGGSRDYWQIYPYLPQETRGYVPAFIAANYVMNYYCEHNICPMTTTLPPSTDTIIVDRDVHFDQIVAVCNVKAEEVKALNPQYRTGLIPGAKKSCILRLPTHGISAFIAAGDSVYTYKSDELFTNRSEVAVSQSAKKSSATRSRSSKSSRSKSRTHTIRSGETLSTIAKRYGTTVSKLKRLNGIKGTSIRAGKKLKVR